MKSLRILAVDDEPSLLQLLTMFFSRLGHQVHACSNAKDALQAIEDPSRRFDVAITDMTMPGMSGEELIDHLLREDAELRILVCSGYPFNTGLVPEASRYRIAFLQKPFLPTMLESAVTALMQQEPAK